MAIEPGSSISFGDGRLKLGDEYFRCYQLFATYGLNELPTMHAVIGPARSDQGLPESYTAIYNRVKATPRGASLSVTFRVTGKGRTDVSPMDSEAVTLWDSGYFEGWGPVSIGGTLLLHIWGSHWMAPLGWETALSDAVHGTGAADIGVPSKPSEKDGLAPVLWQGVTEQGLQSDLWGDVLVPLLKRLVDTDVYGEQRELKSSIIDVLDNGTSSPALSFAAGEPATVLRDIQSTLTVPGNDVTIWDKLVRLGRRFQFTIVPRISDFLVVPLMPSLGGQTAQLKLKYTETSRLQDSIVSSSMRDWGRAYSTSGASGISSQFDVVPRKPVGAAVTHMNKQLSPWVVAEAPWIGLDTTAAELTARTTGLRNSVLAASGYAVSSIQQAGNTANTVYNEQSEAAVNAFLTAQLSNKLYSARSTVLRAGLILDYAPGSQVVFEPPAAKGTDTSESILDLVGTAQRVCLSVDRLSGRSGTWLLLSHLRTSEEQALIQWSNNPLYSNRWLRAPITASYPGFTAPQESG